jgi:hypothetical protein
MKESQKEMKEVVSANQLKNKGDEDDLFDCLGEDEG